MQPTMTFLDECKATMYLGLGCEEEEDEEAEDEE